MHGPSRLAKFFVHPEIFLHPQVLRASGRQRYRAVKHRALRFPVFLMPQGAIGGAPMPSPRHWTRAATVNAAGFCRCKGRPDGLQRINA
jgi:hypothetical protein